MFGIYIGFRFKGLGIYGFKGLGLTDPFGVILRV